MESVHVPSAINRLKTDGLLRTHHLEHCQHDPPACVFCEKSFKTVSNLKRHLATAMHETLLKESGPTSAKSVGKF